MSDLPDATTTTTVTATDVAAVTVTVHTIREAETGPTATDKDGERPTFAKAFVERMLDPVGTAELRGVNVRVIGGTCGHLYVDVPADGSFARIFATVSINPRGDIPYLFPEHDQEMLDPAYDGHPAVAPGEGA